MGDRWDDGRHLRADKRRELLWTLCSRLDRVQREGALRRTRRERQRQPMGDRWDDGWHLRTDRHHRRILERHFPLKLLGKWLQQPDFAVFNDEVLFRGRD